MVRRTGLPAPEPVSCSQPKIAPTVLIRRSHAKAESPVASITANIPTLDRAELPWLREPGLPHNPSGPNGPLVILQEGIDIEPCQLWKLSQSVVFPAYKTFSGTEPECSVPPSYQSSNIITRKTFTGRWLPGNDAVAIETQQSGLRRKPEVTVRGLSNFMNRARGKALTDFPRCMCILADVERGIQRISASAARENAGQQDEGSDVRFSHVSLHFHFGRQRRRCVPGLSRRQLEIKDDCRR